MYCSDFDGDDCTKYEARTRTGLPGTHAYGLEKLFYKYGVDLEIWAHEHSYERMWPLYNRTGCQENTDPFIEHPPPWSAFRSSNYGFSRMQIFNSTHLYFEQLSASKVRRITH
uniref:Iron/zinc purple acid phosphatase-like C-terminal domain-containing protein n=1 Tax=Parascaris equorum TaxID=6256 RepID=A0A914RVM4_PAREQ